MNVSRVASLQWVVFDLSIRVRLSEKTYLGGTAWNAGGRQTSLLGQGGSVGLAVDVLVTTKLILDVQKEANFPTRGGIDVVFRVLPEFVLCTGIGMEPERLSAGFGVEKGVLKIDYAIVWHTVLGVTHRASIRVGD